MSRRDLVESDRPRASWRTIFGHADTKATSKSQLALKVGFTMKGVTPTALVQGGGQSA